jgi:glycerol kinase
MLCDLRSGGWDAELAALFRIPETMLPRIVPSSGPVAEARALPGLESVPVCGIAGDQQAALFGEMCVRPGLTKNTYGTGCFMLRNTGTVPVASRNRLLTTAAWRLQGRTDYALEGSVFTGGSAVQWLRDGLGLIRSAPEVEALAGSVPDNGGVYMVPAFSGLGAPHWDPHARGLIVGVTRATTAGHLARAALEGIAYQVADLADAMREDAGTPPEELRVDGGAARNDLLMQFQADLLGVPVVRPAVTETTALGAAYLAGLGVGIWKDPEEISGRWRAERRFEPAMPRDRVDALRGRWRRARERAAGWAEERE